MGQNLTCEEYSLHTQSIMVWQTIAIKVDNDSLGVSIVKLPDPMPLPILRVLVNTVDNDYSKVLYSYYWMTHKLSFFTPKGHIASSCRFCESEDIHCGMVPIIYPTN